MKHAVLILFACVSTLFSQTGPPSLRCLEVLANGNVILTIGPSQDPGNDFSHYEVYSSIFKNGPFSIAVSSITPVTTTSAVHTSTAALTQTIYYFVRAVEKNNTEGANSDTLQTIHLNIFDGDPALKIIYNELHTPRLSGAQQFTITKEQPAGNVMTLTVTNSSQYFDVISHCLVDLTYRIEQRHSSGCVSKSNIISGTYKDTDYPNEVVIDSISVLPDGRTIIAWDISPEQDVDSYKIIKRNPGGNLFIDSVPGRTSSSYIFNDTEAVVKDVSLFIMARDSCSKQATFDDRPVTMHLESSYDYCRYITRLEWNAYAGMKNGIREYRVYCSVDGGPYALLGTTQQTVFEHDSVQPEKKVSYFVRVVNGDQSITASSNRIYFFTRQVAVPSLNYIISANVNRAQEIEVNVAVAQGTKFQALEIQRSDEGLQFVTLATLPYAGSNVYQYVDKNAKPGSQPYYYKVLLRDSCGNARGLSNICRTIHLAVSANEDMFSHRLNWSPYEGFAAGVAGYRVYRVINDEAFPPVIATTSSDVTTYTDEISDKASEGSSIGYYVQAIESSDVNFPYRGEAASNLVPVYMEGTIYVPNAFAPDGINSRWKPVTHFVDQNEYRVRVFDRWGREVFHTLDDNTAWDGAGCTTGVYVYLINYRNARGEYMEQKGTVMLLR